MLNKPPVRHVVVAEIQTPSDKGDAEYLQEGMQTAQALQRRSIPSPHDLMVLHLGIYQVK
jgi:hypothetical protein